MRPVIWSLAAVASTVTHGVVLAATALAFGVKPFPPQAMPPARLTIAEQTVAASTAQARPAPSDPANAASAVGARVGAASIAQSTARPARPAAEQALAESAAAEAVLAAPVAAGAAVLSAQELQGEPLAAASPADVLIEPSPPTATLAVSAVPSAAAARPMALPQAMTIAAALPPQAQANPAALRADRATPAALPAAVARPSPTLGQPAPPVPATPVVAKRAEAAANPGLAVAPQGQPMAQAPLASPPARFAKPAAPAAKSLPPPSEFSTAALAFSGEEGPLDPLSLAAFQAFTQPGDLASADANGGQVRDGIAAALAAVPCSRLQTSFDPDTGQLEVRGHVPEDGLRAPILAALQAEVGGGLAVTDRLMLLPRPQCQALGAIADVGLAQSTEQETNPRVVGAQTFVRNYQLSAGQRLVFDMTAPDYPAIIYVDYFDAAGNVLHMQPNAEVPARLSAAKSTLAVGQDAPGVPALQLVVGPPFGQEIAVAFAASVPLYQGVRPTIEPAAAYLAFLKAAVAARRQDTPGFKGEWVYFLMTTRP